MKIHKVRVIASVIALLLAEILLTGFGRLGDALLWGFLIQASPLILLALGGFIYGLVRLVLWTKKRRQLKKGQDATV